MPPQHLAIVLDGNRRWTAQKGLPKFLGHNEGAKNLEAITIACIKEKISYLTVYALSTENLKNRTKEELEHIFKIFEKIEKFEPSFMKHGIRMQTIGDLTKLPEHIQTKIKNLVKSTAKNNAITLTIALNYGGRDEIVRAVNKLIAKKKKATEEIFSKSLDTANLPDVDLFIRTGGHKRLSNFLPWQSTYAELYFTDTKWPAFSKKELKMALEWFSQQQRNGGK